MERYWFNINQVGNYFKFIRFSVDEYYIFIFSFEIQSSWYKILVYISAYKFYLSLVSKFNLSLVYISVFKCYTFQKVFDTTSDGKTCWLVFDSKINLNKDHIKNIRPIFFQDLGLLKLIISFNFHYLYAMAKQNKTTAEKLGHYVFLNVRRHPVSQILAWRWEGCIMDAS